MVLAAASEPPEDEHGSEGFESDDKLASDSDQWPNLLGAANETRAGFSVVKLEDLRFAVGYRAVSSDAETVDYHLAPNLSGFLLEALFKSCRDFSVNSTTAITHLLDDL